MEGERTEVGTKNYGIGYRQMDRAGAMHLENARKDKAISFATADKYADAWKQFAEWAREHGVKQMERITPGLVIDYGEQLAAQVDAQHLSAATAQDRVTAVNRVLQIAGAQWTSISSVKDCGIAKRSHVREGTPETLDRQVYQERLAHVGTIASPRGVAVCELARGLGLRSKEASLLDAKKALSQAQATGTIQITSGTKGGRSREIEGLSERQLQTLRSAAQAQGHAKAVMPPDQNWKEWRAGELRTVREAMGGLHELRSAYACERYADITGHAAPCTGQPILDRSVDHGARWILAEELGHGRIDVVSEYIGARA